MSAQAKARRLRAAIKLLNDASEVAIQEWEKEERNPPARQVDGSYVPSQEMYDARRTVLGALGVCEELVQDPRVRLMETSLQQFEARSLHITTEVRMPDILDQGDHEKGVSVESLSQKTGIKAHKLGEVGFSLDNSYVLISFVTQHDCCGRCAVLRFSGRSRMAISPTIQSAKSSSTTRTSVHIF